MLSPSGKAKAAWVSAESFAFTLRQRALDTGFLVIPILLPGFTPADLAQGLLAPSKLQVIQGLSLDPAVIPLDLQPLIAVLNPVLETYRARLTFGPVTLSLASVIDPLGPNAYEIIAQSLGLDKGQWNFAADRSLWLAAALLRSDRPTLEKTYRALARTGTHAAVARQIFRMASPYTWVNSEAADSITRTGLSPKPRPPVTIGARRPETPKFCVLRGSLRAGGWEAFDGEAVFSDPDEHTSQSPPDVEHMLLRNIRKSLQKIAGFEDDDSPSTEDIDEALDDSPLKDEPIFVFLEPWFADMDGALMNTLCTSFPRLVFMVRTEKPQAALGQKFPGIVILPAVTEEEVKVYLMYNRCLPGEKLPCGT